MSRRLMSWCIDHYLHSKDDFEIMHGTLEFGDCHPYLRRSSMSYRTWAMSLLGSQDIDSVDNSQVDWIVAAGVRGNNSTIENQST